MKQLLHPVSVFILAVILAMTNSCANAAISMPNSIAKASNSISMAMNSFAVKALNVTGNGMKSTTKILFQ